MIMLIIRTSKENIDLVVEDYYPRELKYQDEIEAFRNAAVMEQKVNIIQNDTAIIIRFPDNLDADSIRGIIALYRASDKNQDRTYPFSPDGNNYFQVLKDDLKEGKYGLTLDWKYLGRNFKIKEDIIIYK